MANTAPTLNTSADPQIIYLDTDTNPAGTRVSSFLVGADVDGDTVGIAINRLDARVGAWQYSLDGSSWLTIDAELLNSQANELALLLAPDAYVRFLPASGNIAPSGLIFRAWDQTSGSNGSYAVIGSTGGSSSFSSGSTESVTAKVFAGNDAPIFASHAAGTGKVTAIVSNVQDSAKAVALQADRKFVIVGNMYDGANQDMTVVRLTTDGALDTSFNGTGKLVLADGIAGVLLDVLVRPDGKIVVVGNVQDGVDPVMEIIQLNADGTLDTSFNGTGKLSLNISTANDLAYSVDLQPDGDIVVLGQKQGSPVAFVFDRIDASGTVQDQTEVNIGTDTPKQVIVLPDGKILGVGQTFDGTKAQLAVVRLNADFSLDTTFNGTGSATYYVGSVGNNGSAGAVVLSTGKILLGGYSFNGSNQDFTLVRLNDDGSLDTTFNTTGSMTIDVSTGYDDLMTSMTASPDGTKIVLVGYSNTASGYMATVVRLNAFDGSFDTTFNSTGKLVTAVPGTEWDVTIQADSKIVVTGSGQLTGPRQFTAFRLNSDGSYDTTFGATNTATLGGTANFLEDAAGVYLDPNAEVYDAELSAGNNFSGSSITIARHGGASADDEFQSANNLLFVSGNAVLSGTTVGTVTNSGGTLVVTFNASATQAVVNEVLQSIVYRNLSHTPPASVQIDWTFNDGNVTAQGNGGAKSVTGSTTVQITATNDAPTLTGDLAASVDNGASYTLTTSDLGYSDPDDSATGVTFTVANLTNGTLKVDGSAATTFTPADLAASKVVFVHDGSATASAGFDVSVEDGNEDASTPTPAAFTFTVSDPPTVSSIVRAGGAAAAVPAADASVQYTVTFDQSVTGVDVSDFTLTATGTAAGSIASVSGSGTTYTVTVDTISGDGTLRLDLNGSGTGIQNGSTVAIAGGYSSGAAYTLDHTAPSTPGTPDLDIASDSGSSGSDNLTNDATPTFGGTAVEAGATVELFDSDGTTSLGTTTADGSGNWSITASTLAAGAHTVKVKATDAAGNTSTASSGLAITVDTAAPTTLALSKTAVATSAATSTSTIAGLSASDTSSTTYSLATGDGTNDADNGSFSISGSLLQVGGSSLAAGTYKIYVAATDAAGNVANQAFTITVADAPAVSSIVRAGGASATVPTADGSVQYTVTFDQSVTGVDTTDFSLTATGTAAGNIASVSGSGTTYTVTVNSISGDGTLRLDLNGSGTGIQNGSTIPVAGGYTLGSTFTLDHTAPSAPSMPDMTAGTDSGSSDTDNNTSDTTPTFSGTAEAGSTVKLYDTDGSTLIGSGSADGGGNWTITTSALSSSAHTITAKATDAAGNTSSASTGLAITIDTSAPTITFSALAFSNDTGSSNTDFVTNAAAQTIGATLSGGLAGGDIVYASIDNGATWTDVTAKVSGTTLAWDGVTLSGSSTIKLKVTDAAGNDGSVASQAYTLDTTNPTTAFSALAFSADTGPDSSDFITKTSAQTISATLSGAPAGGDIVYGSLDNGASWTDITSKVSGTTLAWDGVTLTGGSTLKLKVTDAAGNDGASASQAYVYDNLAPTTTVATVAFSADTGPSSTDFITSTASQTISGTTSANIAAGEFVEVSVDNGATWSTATTTVGSNTWSISTTLAGDDTLKVRVSDTAGNTGTVLSQAFRLDTTAPTANDDTGDADETGTSSGSDATGDVLGNDSDANAIRVYAVDGSTSNVGAGAAGSHGTFTIDSDGSYSYAPDDSDSAVDSLASGGSITDSIVYTVRDAADNESTATLTVTIHGANDAPDTADDSLTFDEDTDQVLDATAFGVFDDVDSGDSLKAVRIVSLPANGVLTLDGTPVSAGDVVSAADLAANLLVYSPALNDNTDETLTFAVIDQHDAESATYTLTLDLTQVDDLPTGSVTISGTGLAGNTLTATNSLDDVDGIGTISYQWNSDGTPIGGATSDTYLIGSSDVGTVISVTATYIDDDGNTNSVTETMTSAIGSVVVAPPGSTTLVGSAGNDVMTGGKSKETMLGGDGDDVYIVGKGDVVIELAGEGVDTVQATDRFDLGDNLENLILTGNRKGTAVGNALDNELTGNTASNTLIGGGGADTLTGGLGGDSFTYLSVTDSAGLSIDTITDFVAADRDRVNLAAIDANETVNGNQKFKFIGSANFSDFASAAGLVRFDAGTHMLQASVDGDTDAELEILLVGVTSLTERDIVL